MIINVDESDLKRGVLGLVMALLEIIRDALKTQALRRMEGGSLTEAECERLGKAMMEIDAALEEIKEEQGIIEAVRAARDGLDGIVDGVINSLINPEKWEESEGRYGVRDSEQIEDASVVLAKYGHPGQNLATENVYHGK